MTRKPRYVDDSKFLEVFQLVDGRPSMVREICIVHAMKTLEERRNSDTNPKIVQMILSGNPIEHWYYRSDQWVDQPLGCVDEAIQPYVGPANRAPTYLYGPGTYQKEEMKISIDVDMDFLRQLLG